MINIQLKTRVYYLLVIFAYQINALFYNEQYSVYNFGVAIKCVVETDFDFLTNDVRYLCKDDSVTLGSVRENWLKHRRMSY
jgi:hypothetical protein